MWIWTTVWRENSARNFSRIHLKKRLKEVCDLPNTRRHSLISISPGLLMFQLCSKMVKTLFASSPTSNCSGAHCRPQQPYFRCDQVSDGLRSLGWRNAEITCSLEKRRSRLPPELNRSRNWWMSVEVKSLTREALPYLFITAVRKTVCSSYISDGLVQNIKHFSTY